MAWAIEFTDSARKAMRKLDPPVAKRITRYLSEHVAIADDRRHAGKSLKGELREYWRYRVGDHRLICRIRDERVQVLVVRIAHRCAVYR